MASNPSSDTRPLVEVRSIDYVPRNERHGKVWYQGPFWFAGNFVIMTLMIGFIGPSMGLSTLYSILAIALGVGFGTVFMAFHANQGPTMGLPQMIQSRAQFGIKGAILPLAAAFFCYVGFNVFNVILATDAVQTVASGPRDLWYLVWVALAVIIAVVGHDLLHTIQRWLTYVIVAVYVLMTIAALMVLHADAVIADTHFSLDAFLVQLGAAAGYQISYSVYVSDYSRYLPHDTPSSKLIKWTYAGAAISAVWMMSLGALVGSSMKDPGAISSLGSIGNQVFPGFGTFTVLISIPAILGIMAVNFYGAMLSSITMLDAFKTLKPSLTYRVGALIVIGLIAYVVAITIPDQYIATFNTFITLMLYALIPWTSVNLVDFYLVRKGHYAITELFNPHGIYGQWSKPGLIAYLAGIVAMVPFMSLSFYVGPVAQLMGGADIAFLIGLPVAGVAYLLLTRHVKQVNEYGFMPEREPLPENP